MKKYALIAALAALGTQSLMADEPSSAYSVTIDIPYTTKYVFRGVELARDSIQPSVEVTAGSVYLGVWSNQPVVDNTDNEFDFYAGYKYQLNDAWDLDVGATVYYYPELDSSTGGERATTEAYVGINGNVKGFTPGVYTYYDFDLKNTTVQLQLGYSIPVPDAGLSVDFSGNVGRVFADNAEDYNYWSFGVNVPYAISEKATVYAGVAYTNSNLTGAKRNLVNGTVGVSIGF